MRLSETEARFVRFVRVTRVVLAAVAVWVARPVAAAAAAGFTRTSPP